MSNRRSGLLVAAGLTTLTLIVLHDQARHLLSVPDRGDPVFSIWRLAWVRHQLVADPRHVFDANIFYPLRATLTYSDAILVPAITWRLRCARFVNQPRHLELIARADWYRAPSSLYEIR